MNSFTVRLCFTQVAIHNNNCHREEQTREQVEADWRGYEEGEELRREQERMRWLDGLEELSYSRSRRRRIC